MDLKSPSGVRIPSSPPINFFYRIMFTYAILNHLPAIPEHFHSATQLFELNNNTKSLEELNITDLSLLNSQSISQYVGRILNIDGQSIKSVSARRFHVSEEFVNWIKNNIHPDITDAGISFTSGSTHNGAHTDLSRDYVLLYILNAGGPAVSTVFYQEHGHPIVRKKIKPMTNVYVNNYNQLIEIDRVIFPTHTWVLINSDILHGVESIETVRISYQIGFNNNIFFKS